MPVKVRPLTPMLLIIMFALAGLAQSQPAHRPVPNQTGLQSPEEVQRAEALQAQRRYDPLAGQRHLQKSGIENVLDSINPADVDYGTRIASARQDLVDGTIFDVKFWGIAFFGCSLMLAILYILWLHRDRDRRIDIAVNIITQWVNAYLYAGRHAQDAIHRYNKLVEQYNRVAEALDQEHAKKREGMEPMLGSAVDDDSTEADTGFPDKTPANAHGVMQQPSRTQNTGESSVVASAASEQKLRQVAAREAALRQQNQNLRGQIAELVDKIQRLERQAGIPREAVTNG